MALNIYSDGERTLAHLMNQVALLTERQKVLSDENIRLKEDVENAKRVRWQKFVRTFGDIDKEWREMTQFVAEQLCAEMMGWA